VREQGLLSPKRETALQEFVSGSARVEGLLEDFEVRYIAPAPDDLLLKMPEHSLDLVFTLAVLEHVRPTDLEMLLAGQRRVLKPDGLAYHDIGLGDHATGFDSRITYANFLQYGDGLLWKWIGENSIAYHNRLRRSDFSRRFAAHGFIELWSAPRVDPRSVEAIRSGRLRPAPRFAGYEVEDLATWRFAVVLGRRGDGRPNSP
jgi:SAM-dependent methyltransferase